MSAMTWDEALEAFDEHLRQAGTVRQPTRWQYLQQIRWLASSVDVGPWDVTPGHLVNWLDGQNWSAGTRRKVVVAVGQFYAWGVATRQLDWAPTAGLPRRARRRPGPAAEELPSAWREPAAGWVAALRGGSRSEATIEQYLTRLRALSRVAADPWVVTPQQLSHWLSNPDWSPGTKRNSRVAIGSFYRWAVKARHLAESPVNDVETISVPRGLPRPAPHDVVQEAMRASDDRTRLALCLALYAGLRRAEIAGLHVTQVHPTHLVVVGKGGRHRMVPIDPRGDLSLELTAELERRRRGTHGTGWSGPYVSAHGYLFPSTNHAGPMTPARVGELVSGALPDTWTTHTLRHSFATHAYAAERDILAVQQLLGHARPETTSIYAQVPEGALLSAVVGAGPTRLRDPKGIPGY
jgi:site-specific recombinase XerD